MADELQSLSTKEFYRIPDEEKTPKKRPKYGRKTDLARKLRASTYETGPDCKCKRYECFKTINPDERIELIRNFNQMGFEGGANLQSSYLSDLISVIPVSRRRPRQNLEDARMNESSYTYKVKVSRNGNDAEVPVCYRAFQSIFGVKSSRLNTIKLSLRRTGKPPIDGRGKHNNRPHKLSQVTIDTVLNFFTLLGEDKSSLKHTEKVYLPEELNVKKLYDLFRSEYPDIHLSCQTFREIFVSKCKIAFSNPCMEANFCDEKR